MASKSNHLMRTTLSVTLVIFVSKAIGFIREMIMAYYFGRDWITDAYNSAYSLFYLPVLLFSSCVTSTLVPMYIRRENELGPEGAHQFASNTLNLFALLSLIISLLMMLFAEPLVRIVYPGFSAEAHDLTVTLSRIMFPALAFFVAAIVLSTVLNAQEHYLAAQLTGLPLSFALITAAVLFSSTVGIRAQAWGILAAGILQIVILLPALRQGFRYYPTFNLHDTHFRHLMALAVPSVLSMAVNELNHMIDRMLASMLNSGDISSMTYAFKLIMFMTGVLVVPLTTISFSKMSKQAARKDASALIPHVRRSVSLLAFVILPIVCIAGVCSEQVIRLAYGRGRFDEESVRLTGQVFLFYVMGVPFYGMRDLMNRVYHSMENTKTPMIIACISMALNIFLNLLLRGIMGVNGLAFATSVAALVGCVLLARGITKRIGRVFNRKFVLELVKIVFSSALALAASLCMSRLLPDWRGTLPVIGWLILVTLPGAVVYMLSCLALNVKQCGRILSILKRA